MTLPSWYAHSGFKWIFTAAFSFSFFLFFFPKNQLRVCVWWPLVMMTLWYWDHSVSISWDFRYENVFMQQPAPTMGNYKLLNSTYCSCWPKNPELVMDRARKRKRCFSIWVFSNILENCDQPSCSDLRMFWFQDFTHGDTRKHSKKLKHNLKWVAWNCNS